MIFAEGKKLMILKIHLTIVTLGNLEAADEETMGWSRAQIEVGDMPLAFAHFCFIPYSEYFESLLQSLIQGVSKWP